MRALGLGVFVIAVLAVSALLDHESGLGIWLELREDLAGSTVRVEQLVRENQTLRREIEMLEIEPAALDRAIREELDLALPGEVVVRFASSVRPAIFEPVVPGRRWTLRGWLAGERLDRETR